MAELLDAYQRTHETMGTLAKNVGKNNDALQTTSSTVDEHHKQIEVLSATQDMQKESISRIQESTKMLLQVAQMHTERIDLLSARVNNLQEQMERTHKQIFWYLIAVLVINVGSLIYWLSV